MHKKADEMQRNIYLCTKIIFLEFFVQIKVFISKYKLL